MTVQTTAVQQALLTEFDQEMAATRKVLERVPDDRLDWAPHEKSMTIGRLFGHLAELPQWAGAILAQDEFDIEPVGEPGYTPPSFTSRDEFLAAFDENVKNARAVIESTGDQDFMKPWTLKRAGQALFTAPKMGVFRRQYMNHMIHHRGQATVYLRLNDVPVPQTLGPTADEPDML
jgi:uncharacterized damage-inducible protein DinB